LDMFAFVGKVVVAYFLISYGLNIYWRFLRPVSEWDSHKGEWAIVTGSSYGIGAEFSLSLAKRGINVVLCARTKNKLEAIQKQIHEYYPSVKTKILLMDVNQDGWEKALDELKNITVSILVNNVGGGNIDGTARLFHEFSEEHLQSVHTLNLYSTQNMIYKFLPQMVARKKGRIINLSSNGIFFPYKLSVYPADKAFVNLLTKQLNTEYDQFNIRIEALLVGEVSTPAIGNLPVDGFRVCSAQTLSESALDLWGWEELYSPYWGHALLNWLTQNFLPQFLMRIIVRNEFDNTYGSLLENGFKMIKEIHEHKEL